VENPKGRAKRPKEKLHPKRKSYEKIVWQAIKYA